MTKELAKTLTTALVQFIDRERPEGTMCCSNVECERLEMALEEDEYKYVEAFIQRKLSRLTEWEKEVRHFSDACARRPNYVPSDGDIRNWAAELLALAREQFIKDGYVIEKKAFHDAVAKVDPEVMKEVSDNVDKENELAEKYGEGYTKGYKDATKFYNDSVVYRNPTMPTTPSGWGCDGTHCTNPHGDCINCPKRFTTGGTITTPNTACGTSTATLHGNTSATDGKDHNPSFTY